MRIDPTQTEGENVRSLLEENLEYSKRIFASTERTRRYILWGEIMGFIRIILILVPLIAAFFYLKPYLETAFGAYQSMLGGAEPGGGTTSTLDMLKQLNDLKNSNGDIKLEELQKLLR